MLQSFPSFITAKYLICQYMLIYFQPCSLHLLSSRASLSDYFEFLHSYLCALILHNSTNYFPIIAIFLTMYTSIIKNSPGSCHRNGAVILLDEVRLRHCQSPLIGVVRRI